MNAVISIIDTTGTSAIDGSDLDVRIIRGRDKDSLDSQEYAGSVILGASAQAVEDTTLRIVAEVVRGILSGKSFESAQAEVAQ